ncbi:MAG: BatD family protein [Bacteroidales bacterium]|jgi:hypothetical protein|nr:BatD family protein [Bacteroidales bacterium]
MRKLIFILIFCGVNLGIAAQDIKFTATAPQVVDLDKRFEVSFTINTTNVSDFQAPTFRGVQILSGPNQSRSTSMSFINGRQTGGSSVTFSYWLQPIATGTINIAPAKIKAGGTTYTSNALSIRVEQNASSSSGRQNSQSPQGRNQQPTQVNLDNKTLFVRAIPNKTNVVPGEQIMLTYKLYTLVSVSQYQIERSPVSKSFWLEELDAQQQPQITKEVFDGRQYNVATIRKVLVFPQQEGNLTIEPLSLEVTAHVQTKRNRRNTGDPFFDAFFNDPFFSSMFDIQDQPIQKKLVSNSVSINVKSLPNTPNNYIGAVGNFSLSSSIDRTECKENEAITLKYTLSGTGNITLIDKLPIKLPSDFEVYEPTITDEIQKSENGISGKRTFEYIVIPRQEGKFVIDSLAVSFYDTETKQFKTLTSSKYNLTIGKGKESEYMSEQRSEREKYRNMELLPIKQIRNLQNPVINPFSGLWFWLLTILILILSSAFILFEYQRKERNKDIKAVRLRKANRVALKRLRKAQMLLQKHENEAFITEISQSVWNYLEDRFSIERFALSKERIIATLTSFDIEETLINDLIALLERCEMLRFSSEKTFEQNEILYSQALTAISELEIQLKTKLK